MRSSLTRMCKHKSESDDETPQGQRQGTVLQTTNTGAARTGTAAPAQQQPRILITGCQPGANAAGVLQLLQDAGLVAQNRATAAKMLRDGGLSGQENEFIALIDPDTVAAISELSQWLVKVPTAHILALYRRPEWPVAEAIASGNSVEDALTEWRCTAEGLLAVCRRERRRASMLEVHAAASAPGECLAHLSDRLKQRFSEPSISPSDITPEMAITDRAIAALAVQQSAETQALLAELEASSLPVAEPMNLVVPDVESVMQACGADSKTGSTRQQLEDENGLLLLQLHQVQEELERYYLKAQEIEAREKKTAKANKRLRKHITDLKNSRSWRVTLPLRAVFSRLRRRGDGRAKKA
jgi:hypothetical protein